MTDRQYRTALITGAASGIGQATAHRLRDEGWRVIGVDLRDADINIDLATDAGRAELGRAAAAIAPNGIDLAVIAAGISHAPDGKVLAVNYFGAVASVENIRPLLVQRAPAQAILLISTSAMDEVDQAFIDGCLAGDEAGVVAIAAARQSPLEYASSKRALGLWLRRTAVKPEWGGSAIFLNGIAPGFTLTSMTRPLMEDPDVRKQIDAATPRAVPHFAEADVQAEAILALAKLGGNYLVGQILFVDGGTDALRRPDHV